MLISRTLYAYAPTPRDDTDVIETLIRLADSYPRYGFDKLFSLLLGVVMVVAFAAQYPYVSTRTYSTFPIPVPYTVQYFPMCLAGAYMALESLRQMAEHVAEKARGSRAQV